MLSVCYIKVTMNNVYSMCCLVLLGFFSLCTPQMYVQIQAGGILLAGHVCSLGGNCCASSRLNPFEMRGPEVRLRGWEAAVPGRRALETLGVGSASG